MKKRTISTSLLFWLLGALSFSLPSARADEGESPFSSPEEKTFILELAGRDGMIARNEWESGREDRVFFKYISFTSLVRFDLDRDGRINLNEFFDYLVDQQDDRPVAVENSTETAEPIRLGSLTRRAQNAKNTKLQRWSDSEDHMEVRQDLMTRRKILQARRRYAAAMDAVKPRGTYEGVRDLFESRIIKNRLSRLPSSEPASRSSLSHPRMSATPEIDRTRRRDAMQDLENERKTELKDRRSLVPVRSTQAPRRLAPGETPSTREASNIRNLIPPSYRSKKQESAPQTKSQSSKTR